MLGINQMTNLESIAEKLSLANIPDVDFVSYLKKHQSDNDKIKRVSDYYDEIEHFLENGEQLKGSKMPFSKTHELFGFRDGEVTLWTGYNGHKKSMLLGFMALGFLRHSDKVCIASFEMKPVKTIQRMVKQFTKIEHPHYNEYADFMAFAASNLFIFDQLGGITPERIYGVIMYCANELGVKHFVIDSLMRVVAGEDKYNEQKDFVVRLCELAQQTNIHIHLVHHVRDGDESKPSSRYAAKGSKSISDNVHNSLVVWSNKDNNPDMPDVILKCDKQRDGEWEGKLPLRFDKQTLCFEQMY